MNAMRWVLEGLGRRLQRWGGALLGAAHDAHAARPDGAPGPATPPPDAALDAPLDARQRWLQRVAHVPATAWQGRGGTAPAPRRAGVPQQRLGAPAAPSSGNAAAAVTCATPGSTSTACNTGFERRTGGFGWINTATVISPARAGQLVARFTF